MSTKKKLAAKKAAPKKHTGGRHMEHHASMDDPQESQEPQEPAEPPAEPQEAPADPKAPKGPPPGLKPNELIAWGQANRPTEEEEE